MVTLKQGLLVKLIKQIPNCEMGSIKTFIQINIYFQINSFLDYVWNIYGTYLKLNLILILND